MKSLIMMLLALLLAAPTYAQQLVRLPGEYNCNLGFHQDGDAFCPPQPPEELVEIVRIEHGPYNGICPDGASDRDFYRRCHDLLGTPYFVGYTEESLQSSVAPLPENKRGENALIAGAAALTGVILARTLLPELPEGASFRPHANVDFRNGAAFTAANVTAEWRNFRVSAGSSHNGAGWTRPSGRLDWRVEWAF